MSTPVLKIQPKVDATATSTQDDRLNIPAQRRGKKFILAHAPSSWTFSDDVGWVPSLDQFAAVPGVNGVANDGGLSGVIAQAANNGLTVILPTDKRLGDYQGYCVYFDCVDGGRHYCFRWLSPSILPDRTVVWNVEEAQVKHHAFLAYLRDSGIVGEMHEAIYQKEAQKQKQKIADIGARIGVNPTLGPKLKAAETRLDAMKKAWAKMKRPAAIPSAAKGQIDAAI